MDLFAVLALDMALLVVVGGGCLVTSTTRGCCSGWTCGWRAGSSPCTGDPGSRRSSAGGSGRRSARRSG